MSEQRIAPRLIDAEVGDLVFVSGDRWKALPWNLQVVRKIGRDYAYVGGRADSPDSWDGFDRATGAAKPHRGYSPSSMAAGSIEMELRYWRTQADAMAKQLAETSDIETLRTVAFALGRPTAPDFTALEHKPKRPADCREEMMDRAGKEGGSVPRTCEICRRGPCRHASWAPPIEQ